MQLIFGGNIIMSYVLAWPLSNPQLTCSILISCCTSVAIMIMYLSNHAGLPVVIVLLSFAPNWMNYYNEEL